jgi:hypothetical protein
MSFNLPKYVDTSLTTSLKQEHDKEQRTTVLKANNLEDFPSTALGRLALKVSIQSQRIGPSSLDAQSCSKLPLDKISENTIKDLL